MTDMTPPAVKARIDLVKTALLSMQRYNWEQGVAAQAFLELRDRNTTIALARSAIMRQENGRFSVIGRYSPITDAASVGEAVLYAANETGDQLFTRGAEEMLDIIRTTDHRSANGTIYHTQEPTKYIMSDAFYMLPPFLSAAGLFDEAIRQIEGFWEKLWHEKERLLSHIWDDENGSFKREAFWGVGNGWTAAGLSRVIAHLHETHAAEKQKLINYVQALLDGCFSHLRDDGFLHNVIDDPSEFPEINCPQMIAYTVYRGVKAGWLDRRHSAGADLIRGAAHGCVDGYGFVQNVCGVPDFNRSHVAPEGQAFFLLMEAAYADYASS